MGHAALEGLYVTDGPRVLRYLSSLVGNEAAPDLLHDSFVRAARSHNPPERREDLPNWLFRIAANLAIDHVRRKRRWRSISRLIAEPSAPAAGSVEECVRAALREIPPDQATVLILRLVEGMSRSEISGILGITESAMKSRLVRGRLNFAAAYRRLERMQ
ncbi:MAG: sigma-70 family RNA polymerase sigma factor [Chloroflexi bacterium]|nr:sigma-70 family RNA polymerase sigma factor [Chloroflexota bacterium]